MFSAPIHTLEQRAALIDLLARRFGDVSHEDNNVMSPRLGQPRRTSVRVRAGRVVQHASAISVPSRAADVETVDFDLVALATAVADLLHETGIAVTPDQSERYERSLQLARPRSRRELYFTTRAIFLTDVEQLATFNRVFAQVFGAPAGADRHRENEAAQVVAGADRETKYARVVELA
jgi:hypothetical protein